jgi:hypothetical protein
VAKSKVKIERPESEFPELIVTVPDQWPHVKLVPFYDVHHGHALHAASLFKKHRKWFMEEKYAIGWNGGDFFENVVEGSPGIYSQDRTPNIQFKESAAILEEMREKLLFAIPGNHEARTMRGMKFRINAHHGTGAAASPGGQRNAARKDMPWVGADLYWTGHLHQPIADVVYRADYDQQTDRMVSRSSVVIISPSYLRYFGGYGAAKRLGPGSLGITPAILRPDGQIEVTVSAKGTRL